MSTEEQAAEATEEEPRKKSGAGMMIMAAMALGAAAAGFFVPNLAPQLFQAEVANADEKLLPKPEPTEFAFIEFGEAIVNVNSDRFNRYLKTKLTLQVDKEKQADIELLIEERRAMLKGWLLSHLADKTMEEIRGAAGQNRLRREIHDQFNTILFTDGYDPIEDVYFEEFNVQ